jgi:ATPase family associated with various cellular activities (AAA)
MPSFSALAAAHLILRLQPLNRALRAAVERQNLAAARLARPELSSLCITEEHAHLLLDQIEEAQRRNRFGTLPAVATSEELSAETDLRSECESLAKTLPLDRLERDLHLTPFEIEAILLCAAPELEHAYGRVFGFILDDLNRRAPCVELLTTLTADSQEDMVERRHALSAVGRLRRCCLLETVGDAPNGLTQELRLSPGLFEFLAGLDTGVTRLCRDPAELPVPQDAEPPSQFSANEFDHLCSAIEHGSISILGIWGPQQNGAEETVVALCALLERPLRRFSILDFERTSPGPSSALSEQLRIAAALGAALWLDTEPLHALASARMQQALADTLAHSHVLVFLTGEQPWRPLPILRSGVYSELELSVPDSFSREKLWAQRFPELEKGEVHELASRFSLSAPDIQSIADMARMRARLAGNGTPDPLRRHVAAACAVVTRRSSGHFANVIQPRRGPADLILPEKLHRQVLEVATFFQLRAHVDDTWGFGRLLTGSGLKALFTGEPGTGKTLAAEVIASLLELPLYKVDLARILSKWVGETESNLECAFREAEESHAVLFFDEAEALFGKRAEVQHGTDRYANLEVSYLLQRLENSRGLVILASNVKDQIDPAFTRRFQVVVHFPKPDFEERLRIWRLAFPPSAPLDSEVNLEALAQLDMTGAAIVSAARNSALMAADSKDSTITMSHVIRAAARQFRREARVLTPMELGPYAALVQGVL